MSRHIKILAASLSLAGALGLTVAGAVHSATSHQAQKTEAASSTPEGPNIMFHG